MGLYSRYVLPAIITCGCGTSVVRWHRRRIVPQAQGVVLELGFGAGLNLPFYDPAKVSRVYALEPEPGMLARAYKCAQHAPVDVAVLPEKAEALSLADASVDTVLVTFALCTIPDVQAALAGVRRVLKPDGRFLFCDHGRSPDEKVARAQDAIEPVWKRLFGGCHLTRDIPALVQASGFSINGLEAAYMPKTPRFAGYVYRGSAQPVN